MIYMKQETTSSVKSRLNRYPKL